jgi:hypothetical protein
MREMLAERPGRIKDDRRQKRDVQNDVDRRRRDGEKPRDQTAERRQDTVRNLVSCLTRPARVLPS